MKFFAVVPTQFRDIFAPLEPRITPEEELVLNSRVSLYAIEKEQWNYLECHDPKYRHIEFNGIHHYGLRREQDDEDGFFSFEIICTASVVSLILFVVGLLVIFK